MEDSLLAEAESFRTLPREPEADDTELGCWCSENQTERLKHSQAASIDSG